MALSLLEIEMRADALVRLMRSDAPLERARGLVIGASDQDRRCITEAFVARGWGDGNLPVPERGARLQDWLIGLRDEP